MGNPFEPVKIGVVGLGRFGRLHALTIDRLTEAELVGLVARREASLHAVADELPGIPGWTNLEKAVKESDAEAWIVACTTASHVPVTRTLLEAGKTVLLEKPIAADLNEAHSLQPLVASDSSNLMIGHIVLFNSEFRQLQQECQQYRSLSYINCVRHRPASIIQDFAGENPLHSVMVHDLYATQVLVNRSEPTHFSAQYHRTPQGEVDLALAQLKWPEGTVASFAASYTTPSGMPPRGFDRTEVFGSGWAARSCPNPRPVEVWNDQAAIWPLALEIRTDPSGPTGMMAEELRCFCQVVRKLTPPPIGTSYTDAIQVQQWMDQLEHCAH